MVRVPAAVAVTDTGAHPGSVIRAARLAKRETQRQTGKACGFSQSEISRIESGKAHAYDIRHLGRLARHLDIPPELLGLAPAGEQDTAVNRREFVTSAAAIAAGAVLAGGIGHHSQTPIEAGFTSGLLRSRWLDDTQVTGSPTPDLPVLARAVARAKSDYQACQYSQVAGELPGLLSLLETATSTLNGDDRREAEALAADAYHVAASLELKLGHEGPAWMAADASMRAAQRSEDPVMMASSARIVTHALMDAHRYADAETVARRMAEKLAATWTDPSGDALSVYGTLLLRGAIAAARAGNTHGASELLEEAGHAADRLGADRNLRWTAFGPTNVTLHRVNIAVTLGNAGVALDNAKAVQFDNIPITERKATFLLDVAGAFLQWGKHDQACDALCAAERFAPQEPSRRPAVRQLIADTWTGAPASVSLRMRQLAQRTGIAA